MQLCQGENFFFFSTLVVQEDLILFQLVRPLHRFLLPSSGFPFFGVLDKTVWSLSLQNRTDTELTNGIRGGSC